MDTVELVMAVEEHFSIEIDDEAASLMVTCGSLSDFVAAKLRARGDARSEEEVWLQVKEIIVEQLGVKPAEVTREAKVVEDLGAG